MRSRLYNVAFTVVLCALSAAALTFANSHWGPVYLANLARDRNAAVLEAAGIVEEAPAAAADVNRLYVEHVRETKRERIFKVMDGEKLVAWAIEMEGMGLEGPIRAILAVEPNRQKVVGFRVYHQEETPGLGSRVADPEFTRKFPGKSISGSAGPGMKIVKNPKAPNEVEAITGPTLTLRAVERMLNVAIQEFLAGRKLVPLVLELPERGYATPPVVPPGSSAQLPTGEPRPPFMVPEGLTNVARGLKVRVSDDEEPVMGDLKQITDGVKDAGADKFVEIGFMTMWVQLDLGRPHEIYAAVVWHDHRQPAVYHDVIVQVADDAEFAENVRTLFNNDRDDSSELGAGTDREYFETHEGTLIDTQKRTPEGIEPAVARYIRFYSNGNSIEQETNRYTEIEVYGKPAPPPEASGEGAGGADAGSGEAPEE